jgi:uncharacterized protein with HEPN domain
MSERTDADLLEDIREAARRIRAYLGDLSSEQFIEDLKTQDAVIRNLEIIGEAVKNLSDELRVEHAAIPWKNIAGMRDRLIHHYFGVNLDVVWQVASVELPEVVRLLPAGAAPP